MTTFKDSTRVIRNPGTVIVAPTSLTAGADGTYGGSIIGSVRAMALTPLGEPYRIMSEGLGEYTDVLEAPNHYAVVFFLRGWEKAGVQNLLDGGYAEGSTSRQAVWTVPGTKTPGQSASDRAKVWLFVPDDTEAHPALIIRSGIADFSTGAEIAFQHQEELGLAVSIECLRDSSNKTLDLGLIDDLTL